MATETAAGNGLDELSQRLELLEREAAGLRAALHASQRARMLLFLLVIAFLGGFGFMFYKSAKELMAEETLKTLRTMAQARIDSNEKALKEQGGLLMNNIRPVLETAFKDRFAKDEPLFSQAVQKESDPFKKEMQQKLNDLFLDHYVHVIREHKGELEKQHPELQQRPEMYTKLENGLVEGAKRMINESFARKYLQKLQKLETEFAQIPSAPETKQGEPTTAQQLIGHLSEFAAVALAKGNTLAIFDDDSAKAASGGGKPSGTSKPPAANQNRKGI